MATPSERGQSDLNPREPAGQPPARQRALLAVALITLLVYAGVVAVSVRHYRGNLSSLIVLGDRAVPSEKEPNGYGRHVVVFRDSPGYDGQTYYYVTDDPFLRRRAFRSPQRYGRIGYPLLIWALTLGQRDARPVAMIAINLLAVTGVVYLAGLIILQFGRGTSPWWALAAALNPSLLIAVQKDLAEPMTTALALGGLLLYLRQRVPWAALLFACALLTREVAVLFLLPIIAAEVWARRVRYVAMLLSCVAPYLIWQALVAYSLGQSNAAATQSQFGRPLAGIIAALGAALHGAGHRPYYALLVAMVAFVAATLIASASYIWRRPDVVAGSLLLHGIAALFTGPAIWLGFDNVARVYGGLYPLVIFAFARYRSRPLALLVGGLIVLTAVTCLRVAQMPAVPYYLTP